MKKHYDGLVDILLGIGIPIVAGVLLGSAINVVLDFISDQRTIRKIRSGEITEKDLVQQIVDKFEADFKNSSNTYTEKEIKAIELVIKKSRACSTFEQLGKLLRTDKFNKLKRMYEKAKKTKLDSRIVRDSAKLMRRKMFVKHCDDLNPIEPKILNRMMMQIWLLDDLTNHWSGKLPNLYSSVDKLR